MAASAVIKTRSGKKSRDELAADHVVAFLDPSKKKGRPERSLALSSLRQSARGTDAGGEAGKQNAMNENHVEGGPGPPSWGEGTLPPSRINNEARE